MAKTIFEQWKEVAYNEQTDKGTLQRFWTEYFTVEKNVYAVLLSTPDEVVKGTVKELADKYNIAYNSQSIEIGVRVEVRVEVKIKKEAEVEVIVIIIKMKIEEIKISKFNIPC